MIYAELSAPKNREALEEKFDAWIERNHPEKYKAVLKYFLQPVEDIHFCSNVVGELSTNNEIRVIRLFFAIAVITVLIAATNCLNIVTARSSTRAREIGIRKVMGASASQLAVRLSREFVALVFIANVIGWPVAYHAMSRWLQQFAYRLKLSLGIFLLAATGALLVAILTISIQTIRVAMSNPVKALRYE